MIPPLPPASAEAGRARARFTFLGPEGTFTESALRQIPEVAEGDVTPSSSVISALAAVRAGEADLTPWGVMIDRLWRTRPPPNSYGEATTIA